MSRSNGMQGQKEVDSDTVPATASGPANAVPWDGPRAPTSGHPVRRLGTRRVPSATEAPAVRP